LDNASKELEIGGIMQLLGFGSAELVGIVTGPQAECLKNYGLIHSRDKVCLFSATSRMGL